MPGTAIFSVVNAVLLRPLPYRNPEELVLSEGPISNAGFFDSRDGTRAVFDNSAAVMVFRAIVPHEDGSAEKILHSAGRGGHLGSSGLLRSEAVVAQVKFYFDDDGCLKCGKVNTTYGSNGLCKLCMQQVKLKLFFAVKRRWTAAGLENLPRTFQRMADAQRSET